MIPSAVFARSPRVGRWASWLAMNSRLLSIRAKSALALSAWRNVRMCSFDMLHVMAERDYSIVKTSTTAGPAERGRLHHRAELLHGLLTTGRNFVRPLGLCFSINQPAGRYGRERDEVTPVNPMSYGAAAGRRLPAADLAGVSGSVAAVPRRAAVP